MNTEQVLLDNNNIDQVVLLNNNKETRYYAVLVGKPIDL